MPGVIDPETIAVDDLPTIWSPVQGDLSPEDHRRELEDQATASLLWASPVPEQILRLVLDETAIDPVREPPPGYDPDVQGPWDASLLTFGFRRPIRLMKEERTADRLVLEYKLEGAGTWRLEFTPESLTVDRL